MHNSGAGASILIVTVIFNQKLKDTNVWKTLLSKRQCCHAFIYDNSPSGLNSCIGNLPPGFEYIHDPSNPGLSHAYNKAAEYASAHGIEWILISDQDTIFPDSALDIYRLFFERHEKPRMFIPKVKTATGMYLSPVKSHGYIASLAKNAPEGDIKLKDYAVINSGILVTTNSFLSCGGYNEDVFLDFSDYQFIERFADKYHSAYVINLELLQNFSNISDSPEKKLARFRLFRRSLSGFQSSRRLGRLQLRFIILKRALSLCISTRSLRPLALTIFGE